MTTSFIESVRSRFISQQSYEHLDSEISEHRQRHSARSDSSQISKYNVVHHLQKRKLLIAINCVAGLSIFFFGYDQGMMGGVNNAENYYDATMHFGHKDPKTGAVIVTNAVLQGAIVSVYYLGTLCGCLFGGSFADRHGRIRTIGLGAAWAAFGAVLQASAQDQYWMIFARFVNGIGTGILNAVVPVWATEVAEHTSRGQFIAIEFTLNIFGVGFAYWIEYACSFYGDGTSQFIWRFPIAFQILPLIMLLIIVWFFPESPRWLAKIGREDEARYILGRLRGEDGGKAEAEFQDIQHMARLEKKASHSQSYLCMLLGSSNDKLHVNRRVHLVVWLQIMQEWVGIAGVTIYQPTIFRMAGISNANSGWVSGLNNTIYMFATLICVFTLDRIGRRWTLYWGSFVQGIAMFLAGAFSHLSMERSGPSVQRYGIAAVFSIYLFTATFGATWLTVPWLYPAEIFPLEVRAKGNAWGVVGWSIGNAWLTLLCPVMFEAIGEKTLYIFAVCNAITIPMVWALYPETNQRTLEEINLVFASDSIWNWEAERCFKLLQQQSGDSLQAADSEPLCGLGIEEDI